MFGYDALGTAEPVGTWATAGIDAGRVQLLVTEALGVSTNTAAASVPWMWLAGGVAVVGLAAFGGTYLGLKYCSFARIREEDGWREVTYRFRASNPLRMSGEVLQRMSGILSELEDLGHKIRSAAKSAGNSEESSSEDRTPILSKLMKASLTPVEEPKSSTPSEEPSTPKPRLTKPVTFSRRVDPEEVKATDPLSTNGEPSGLSGENRTRVPARYARDAQRKNRAAKIQRARRLLRDGHDPTIVREITGLKLAELDLIGWSSDETPSTQGV